MIRYNFHIARLAHPRLYPKTFSTVPRARILYQHQQRKPRPSSTAFRWREGVQKWSLGKATPLKSFEHILLQVIYNPIQSQTVGIFESYLKCCERWWNMWNFDSIGDVSLLRTLCSCNARAELVSLDATGSLVTDLSWPLKNMVENIIVVPKCYVVSSGLAMLSLGSETLREPFHLQCATRFQYWQYQHWGSMSTAIRALTSTDTWVSSRDMASELTWRLLPGKIT